MRCESHCLPIDNRMEIPAERGEAVLGWNMTNQMHFLAVIFRVLQPTDHLNTPSYTTVTHLLSLTHCS